MANELGKLKLELVIECSTTDIVFELNKKREKITFDELSNLFVLFLAAFPFLFVVFIV